MARRRSNALNPPQSAHAHADEPRDSESAAGKYVGSFTSWDDSCWHYTDRLRGWTPLDPAIGTNICDALDACVRAPACVRGRSRYW